MMDCGRLHERLDDWLADRLDATEAAELRAHLEACDECRAVEATLRSDAQAPDLLSGVLAQTSGRACAGAREHLGDWVDGTLEREEAALVAGHLGGCAECARLATVMRELQRELRGLAERSPGPNFTADVLLKTLPQPSLGAVFWRRLRDAAQAALTRPAFPQEAAFAVTVLLVLLTATPFAPWPQLPARALGVVQDLAPAPSVDATVDGPVVVFWNNFAQSEPVRDLRSEGREVGQAWSEGWRARTERQTEEIRALGTHLRATGGHLLDGSWPEFGTGMQQIGCDLKRMWEGLRTPDTRSEDLCG